MDEAERLKKSKRLTDALIELAETIKCIAEYGCSLERDARELKNEYIKDRAQLTNEIAFLKNELGVS